jgi:Fe-S cluster assembly ATP-binding protein
MLQIENHVRVEEDGREILRGLFTIGAGEVHAIMGPNARGSRRSPALAGKPGYEVTDGAVRPGRILP